MITGSDDMDASIWKRIAALQFGQTQGFVVRWYGNFVIAISFRILGIPTHRMHSG